MQDVIGMIYPWLKAGHIIFVIFWMAGLFMLPRFFIYHQETEIGSAQDSAWIERETRLMRIILTPSMIVVWVFGVVLAWYSGAYLQGWFHAKLLFVLLLSGYHGWMAGYAKKLAREERLFSDKKLRLLNEVPGLAVALIVVLAVVRPF